ncbi:MAG: mannose-1-phosphate guanylyltransferase [Tannerellaceae bacterium]|jgi:mannose-1-phosphate guanylyltransferase|nr:mannose-1-phosphate guanylyltransferase [Tannerellaceae bacterium]
MKDNYCVIMGGGVGSRFWPFSKESYPKQFLDFFGEGHSLLQQTFDRFAKIIPIENIIIVTNAKYVDLIKEQIPELPAGNILAEPLRRNTAPCIAYASYHIRQRNPRANIVVAPSDHLIIKEDVFLKNVESGLKFVEKHPALVTLGVKTSRAETAYGYIQSSDLGNEAFVKVKTFVEKPDQQMAQIFHKSDEFFWNSGLFLWNVETIIEAIAKHCPGVNSIFESGTEVYNTPMEPDFINAQYPYCENISIDYGVMEKADNVYMMRVDFGWADLGTWGSLYDQANKRDAWGNVLLKKTTAMIYDSSNNLIAIDDPDRLVIIEGLEDHIVAESDNVLLICKKKSESRIKEFIANALLKFGKKYL